jgi:hypothetical protein
MQLIILKNPIEKCLILTSKFNKCQTHQNIWFNIKKMLIIKQVVFKTVKLDVVTFAFVVHYHFHVVVGPIVVVVIN